MFDIQGVDSTYKVPRFYGRIDFGAGRLAPPGNRCLLVGMITSSGTMTANVAPIQCTSEDEADTFCGPGSQLASMCYAAFKQAGGGAIDLWIAAVAEPTGTKATATLTITAGQTVAGSCFICVGGISTSVSVAPTDTADTWGAAAALAINGNVKLPVTATYTTGVLTLTCKNKGIQGKDWLVCVDQTQCPSGFSIVVAGSAAQGTNRVRMGASASGTGTEDVTTLLTTLIGTRWARIGVAQYDTANLALWKAQVAAEAGPTALRLMHYYVGYNNGYSTAASLASSTLNDQRARLRWHRNTETHPSQIAAAYAALAAITEVDDPVPDYDGFAMKAIAPQRYQADPPTDTEANTALNNGVTPGSTVDGASVCLRGIVTHCLTSGSPDFRTLDDGDATFPDYALYDLKSTYVAWRGVNKYVGPTPADGDPEAPAGVGTPALWDDEVRARMIVWFQANWIQDAPVTDDTPTTTTVASVYNAAARRIQSACGFVVRPVQHQLGQIVKQVST